MYSNGIELLREWRLIAGLSSADAVWSKTSKSLGNIDAQPKDFDNSSRRRQLLTKIPIGIS
jgi:hypothetical protein